MEMECHIHKSAFSLVCVTCDDKLLCTRCIDDHSQGHRFNSLFAVTNRIKNEKQVLLTSVEADVTKLTEEIAAVRVNQNQLHDIEREENQTINDQRAVLHSMIDEIADYQIQFSATQKMKNISVLQGDEALLTKQLQERETYGKALKEMLESTDEIEILQKAKHFGPTAPLSFPLTPLQSLKFCAGQINKEEISCMFGDMIDLSEDAEAESDFFGSLRIKSADIEDSKEQDVKKQHGDNKFAQRPVMALMCDQEKEMDSPSVATVDPGRIAQIAYDNNDTSDKAPSTLTVSGHAMEILQAFDFKKKCHERFPTANLTLNCDKIEVSRDFANECQEMMDAFLSGLSKNVKNIPENRARFLMDETVKFYVNKRLINRGLHCVWFADETELEIYSTTDRTALQSFPVIIGCVKEYTLGPVTSTNWKHSEGYESLRKNYKGKFRLFELGRKIILVGTDDVADDVKKQLSRHIL